MMEEPDPPLAAISPLTALMRRVFESAKWLSRMWWLRLVASVQGLVGILLEVLVFGRFAASLPQVSGVFGEKRQ